MSSPDLAVKSTAALDTVYPTKPSSATVHLSLLPLRSTKIQDVHLAKLAIVYVRQSSPHQVLEHRESRENKDWHDLFELCAIFQTLLGHSH